MTDASATEPSLSAADTPPEKPLWLQAELTITAADEGSDRLPTMEAVAYTGAAIRQPWSFDPVVVDAAGVKVSASATPFLFNHDPGQIVGHGEVQVLQASGRIKASGVISGGGEAAEEVRVAGKNKFPWQASIGGEVLRAEFVEAGVSVKVNGRNHQGPVLVVREFELREVSVVAMGADAKTSVRVAAGNQGGANMPDSNIAGGQSTAQQSTNPDAIRTEMAACWAALEQAPDELQLDDLREKIVAGAITPHELKAQLYDRMQEHRAQEVRSASLRAKYNAHTPTLGGGRSHSSGLPHQRLLEAAVVQAMPGEHQAGLVRAYRFTDDEQQQAEDRYPGGVKLSHVLMEAAWAAGFEGRHFSSGHGAMKRMLKAAFSTIEVPGILSNLANKFVRVAFENVESTWRSIASVGNASDFKERTTYSLTGDLTYEKLHNGGQIKHGTVGEETYKNKADTYAKMLSISRTDIVNDEMQALSRALTRLARGAALALNDVFWKAFKDEAGGTIFTTGRNNLVEGTEYKLDAGGIGALNEANKTFVTQTDPDGKPLGSDPRILLVPPALEMIARQLMNSNFLNLDGSPAQQERGSSNPFANRYQVAMSRYLSDPAAWYLIASPADLPLVEVVFLDGRETPQIDTAEADFDELGIQMRGYHDFGVAYAEHRAGVKVTGVAAA